jgi:hypothetical protein
MNLNASKPPSSATSESFNRAARNDLGRGWIFGFSGGRIGAMCRKMIAGLAGLLAFLGAAIAAGP